ncbi:epididymal-specific lipocalin-9 isoform X3 [Heterocephalus glaber]|uniref:Epididymal-specific lipocalin-9 isoform X3 n=1 Tax=Heterocephalus glaber TaxID=10181 RepID=A0AAX6TBN0_HETGA|nr:epididymal-specific lipocalin-9 isoform X3 [Heterocephalus glaber]XP_004848928.1 epididymal-specific lipocalin-9 isoform X3 [Heterocephalus glaber]XP_021117205.1 epididymal-specific lipocalin-9 isoform X3 [Heterocephalus glaber]
MLLLLLGLVLSLALAQKLYPEEIVEQDFNMTRAAGSWSSISLASDNVMWIGVNGDLHLFIRTIELLLNSSLLFHFRFWMQGECVFVTVVCEKTPKNAEFSTVYRGENKVLILETDYWMYIIFYLKNVRFGIETQVLALYGRIPVLSDPLLDRFEKAYRKYGMGPRNTINLAEKDLCQY